MEPYSEFAVVYPKSSSSRLARAIVDQSSSTAAKWFGHFEVEFVAIANREQIVWIND